MTVRTSSISLYSEIARENIKKLTALESKIDALKSRNLYIRNSDEAIASDAELFSLEIALAKCASIVIVFAAVTVEAHIYDYAARRLSDKFARSFLDRLDTISKWMIVPQLITGKSLSKNGRWLTLMQSLIKERNGIVHSKSHEPPFDFDDKKKFYKKVIESNRLIPSKAYQAIELLDILTEEVSKLDPEESLWIHSHLK